MRVPPAAPRFSGKIGRVKTRITLRLLVPGERFELPTNGLQNRCSTTELTRQINELRGTVGVVCYHFATQFSRRAHVTPPVAHRQHGRRHPPASPESRASTDRA